MVLVVGLALVGGIIIVGLFALMGTSKNCSHWRSLTAPE